MKSSTPLSPQNKESTVACRCTATSGEDKGKKMNTPDIRQMTSFNWAASMCVCVCAYVHGCMSML